MSPPYFRCRAHHLADRRPRRRVSGKSSRWRPASGHTAPPSSSTVWMRCGGPAASTPATERICIKIMTTGGVFSQGDKATPHSHFSQEEIRAAVEEAENMGSYVSTHAQATRGINDWGWKTGRSASSTASIRTCRGVHRADGEERLLSGSFRRWPSCTASKLYFQGKEGARRPT